VRTLLKVLVSVIGVAALVFGIIFIIQSGSAKQQVADGIAPVSLQNLDAIYDSVTAQQKTMMAGEEPNIQAGKAQPSPMYIYLTAQRTGLGLARANVGTANLILTMGIIDVVLGLGLIVSGVLIPSKSRD